MIILFINFQLIQGQKLWTLEDCINYAKENNLNIKQQQLNIKLAEKNLLQSYTNLLPNINGFSTHGYNYGLTIDRYTNEFAKARVQSDNFYLSSSLTIFNGLQNQNTIIKNRADLMSTKYDTDKLMNDVSMNIAAAYVQILYNIEILNSAKSQIEDTKQQVERDQKLYEAGTIAKNNLLAMEAQAATDELSVVNAQNSLDISYLTLKQMLDLSSEESFDIVKPQFEITGEELLKEKPEEIYKIALTNQPDVKSGELKLLSSNKALSIARGMRSPLLSLQGSAGTGYSGEAVTSRYIGKDTIPIGYTANDKTIVNTVVDSYSIEKTSFNKQLNDNVNKSIGLNLTIPILNGFQTDIGISKSKIAIQNAQYSLQIIKLNLNKTIEQAYADAKGAFIKYNATKKSLDALEESYKYAQEKYNVGMLNFVDYNDAKAKYIKAISELVQAKYYYLYRIKVLDFYKGKPLY
jgi:outer membrane protein